MEGKKKEGIRKEYLTHLMHKWSKGMPKADDSDHEEDEDTNDEVEDDDEDTDEEAEDDDEDTDEEAEDDDEDTDEEDEDEYYEESDEDEDYEEGDDDEEEEEADDDDLTCTFPIAVDFFSAPQPLLKPEDSP